MDIETGLLILGGILAFVAFVALVGSGMSVERSDGHMDMSTYRLTGIMIKVGIVGLVLLVAGAITKYVI